jgi:NAD(P)-dependent dehydrogenase (short-subunit alcohol dehydrogenase family)
VYPADVTDYDAAPALFEKIASDLTGIDIVVYAAGVLPKSGLNEFSFEKDRLAIDVNLLGAMAWLNVAARRMGTAQAGCIVGIGSVAGDRVRSANAGYGTSKAAFEGYLESLRNRVGRYGVQVTTIKPGFVATAMVAGMKTPIPPINVDDAARLIVAAIEDGARVRYVPAKWRFIMSVVRAIPSPIFQRLKF